MFKKNKKENITGKVIDTLIGPETSMSGELYAKGIVRIEGFYKGEIVTESDLIIGEKADVKGDIKCVNATVAGKIEGNMEVEKKLEIFKSGNLSGDINVGSLMIEDGAFFSGKCFMNEREINSKEEFKGITFRDKKTNERKDNKSNNDNEETLTKGKEKPNIVNVNKQAAKK